MAPLRLSAGSMSVLFGFMSGTLMAITGVTLNMRFAEVRASTAVIGCISIASLPYALSFLVQPLVERVRIPILSEKIGHSAALLIMLHMIAAFLIYRIGIYEPHRFFTLVILLSAMISAIAAIQENVFGGIRARLYSGADKAFFSGLHSTGMRMGLIAAGPVTIYCSSFYSWRALHGLCACVVALFPCLTWYYLRRSSVPGRLLASSTGPAATASIGRIPLLAVAFVVLYTAPDCMVVPMLSPFLLKVGYSLKEISTLGQMLGFVVFAVGSVLGAITLRRFSICGVLATVGAVHAFANLGYVALDYIGKSSVALALGTIFVGTTAGMKVAASTAFMTALCSTAGQYAVITSSIGLTKALLPMLGGVLASYVPWDLFFSLMFFAAFPSVLLAPKLRRLIHE